MHQPEDGGDIGVHQLRPCFRVPVRHRPRHINAGIGEQDVDPGKGLDSGLDQTSRLARRSQVTGY